MKKILFILLMSPVFVVAQTISTFAGSGTPGYHGDGGAATEAELYSPAGVAVDGSGNVYIADLYNQRIRKISTSGIISTFAGNGWGAGTGYGGYSGDGGAATAAELFSPTGVAIDGSGNVYIADQYNSRVRKVNTSGIISTIAGNGWYGYSGDGGAATAAVLNDPIGVAVDGSGNVYIADVNNNRIRKVNSSGVISTIAGDGTAGFSGDGGAATSAELINPFGVAVDGSGNVYIADYNNYRIRKVNTSGVISTIAGTGTVGYGGGGYSGDGGAATAAELFNPSGVVVDGLGNVYIADYNNSRIRKINSSGLISTFAGDSTAGYSGDGGPATAGELSYPTGIAVDGSGNVYIADEGNNRIREVTAEGAGIGTVQAGSAEIIVYPNPATHQITISSGQTISSITITNLLGQIVYSQQYYSSQVQLDVADFPAGMYFVRVNGTEVRKFGKK